MHSIQIPDSLWEAHGGSPEKMRTILWETVLENAQKEDVSVQLRGTRITARYRTVCPVCKERIEPGTEALMVDWEDGSRAIHGDCSRASVPSYSPYS